MRSQGEKFEQIAKTHLIKQGLTAVCDNFNCRVGEIDLIMSDNNTLVFVEVKHRKNDNFGGSIAAVSRAKQNKIIKTSMFYCQKHNINFEQLPCRFDVVAITGLNEPFKIQWIRNAFPN